MTQVRSAALEQRHGFTGTDIMMFGMVLIWGFNFPIIKIALRSLPPFSFNLLRFALATVMMVAIVWARGESLRVARRDLPAIALFALSGHGLYQIAFISGLARTTAGNSSLLLAAMPIFAAIYAHIWRIERANRLMWAGILVSFGGILLLVLGGGREVSLAGTTLVGDLLTLGAAMLWAAGATLSKPLLVRYSPIKMTALQMVIGTPVLALVGLPGMVTQDWRAVPLPAWLAVLYCAILATVVAYVLWSTGVQRMGSNRTVIYSNVTPIVAVAGSWLLLGDSFQPGQALGAAVVLSGLVLTRLGRSR